MSLPPHPVGRERFLTVADIRESEPPTKAPGWLVDSIRRIGVICSIITTDDGKVIDGRRRVAAARAVGLQTIPARVFKAADLGPMADELGVSLNSLRSDNPVTSRRVALSMLGRGLSVAEVGDRTGLQAMTVRALAATADVPPEVEQAFTQGRLRLPALRAIASSSARAKRHAVKVIKSRGVLTARDAAEAIRG